MRLKQILLGFLGLGLLAACSQDDVVPSQGGINTEPKPDGYIAVNLNLPTVNGTRAGEEGEPDTPVTKYEGSFNDQFADGEKSEYAVNNGLLVLFKGTSEANAEYMGAYDIGFPLNPNGNPNNTNVTVSYDHVVQVTGLRYEKDQDVFALVLLNYNSADIRLTSEGLKIGDNICTKEIIVTDENGNETSKTPGTKYEKISEWTVNHQLYHADKNGAIANQIFMTNAPLSNNLGGNINPIVDGKVPEITTLVKVTDNIELTEKDALEHPAAIIHVERGVAKVTCSEFAKFEGKALPLENITLSNGCKLVVTNVEWAIGNEEYNSFVIHNCPTEEKDVFSWGYANSKADTPAKYRMISHTQGINIVDDKDKDGNKVDPVWRWRTYWGQDPNYTTNKYDENITYPAPQYAFDGMRDSIKWDKNAAFYTHENVFDVEHMKYGNTTRLGFWVTFQIQDEHNEAIDNQNFYTRDNDRKTLYFDNEDGNPLEQFVYEALSKNVAVRDVFLNALKDKEGTGSLEWNPVKFIEVKTEMLGEKKNNLLAVKSIEFKDDDKDNPIYASGKPTFDFKELIDSYNSTYKFYQYTAGKAFYEVRIHHFGNSLTPWTADGAATTIDTSYPDTDGKRNDNWLGRYGLLRNNWYDIQVGSITKLGDPADPAKWNENWKDTPDDNNDQYLSVKIRVLSWAKRVQHVDF